MPEATSHAFGRLGQQGSGIKDQGSGDGGCGSFGSAALRSGRQERDADAVRAAIGRPQKERAAELDLSNLTPVQRQIAEALMEGPLQLDTLIDKTGLPASQILPQLTVLQIKKLISQNPGKIYELT